MFRLKIKPNLIEYAGLSSKISDILYLHELVKENNLFTWVYKGFLSFWLCNLILKTVPLATEKSLYCSWNTSMVLIQGEK